MLSLGHPYSEGEVQPKQGYKPKKIFTKHGAYPWETRIYRMVAMQ